MADWREHQGVFMWAVANYVECLRGDDGSGDDLEEIYATCRDVMEHLPHDHATRLHAAAHCEAALRLGRVQEFKDAVARYRLILEDDSDRYRMTDDYKHMPHVLLIFEKLLGHPDAGADQILEWTRAVRRTRRQPPDRWVQDLWKRMVRDRLGFWQRLRVGWALKA